MRGSKSGIDPNNKQPAARNEILVRIRSVIFDLAFRSSDIAIHPKFLIFMLMSISFGALLCFFADFIVNVVDYTPLTKTWGRYWIVGPAIGTVVSWYLFLHPHNPAASTQQVDSPNLDLIIKYWQSIPQRDRHAMLAVALMADLEKREDAPKKVPDKSNQTQSTK